MAIKQVFLGGTTSLNEWCKGFIERFEARGINRSVFIDPVVPKWTDEAKAREYRQKADRNILKLYYLGDTGDGSGLFISSNSQDEAHTGLYDDPERTAVVFDTTGLNRSASERLMIIHDRWVGRFPNAPIFQSLIDIEEWLHRFLLKELV